MEQDSQLGALSPFEREAGLDAADVKAMFAALRSMPGALSSVRDAYDRVKERLTPGGRVAFHKELARLYDVAPELVASAASLSDLLPGDYGLVVRGDDGSEHVATLRCDGGRVLLDLHCGCVGAALRDLAIGPDGTIDASYVRHAAGEDVRLTLRGKVTLRDGYLLLDARAQCAVRGELGERSFTRQLKGSGDTRPARA